MTAGANLHIQDSAGWPVASINRGGPDENLLSVYVSDGEGGVEDTIFMGFTDDELARLAHGLAEYGAMYELYFTPPV